VFYLLIYIGSPDSYTAPNLDCDHSSDCILVLERVAEIRGPRCRWPSAEMDDDAIAFNVPKRRAYSPESGRKLTGGQSA
jgi:hypothetical protein